MKKIFIIGIIIFFGLYLFGQNQQDSIIILGRRGTHFEQDGKKLEIKDLLVITESNPAAYKEIKFANSNAIVGTAFCSGFCLFVIQQKYFPFNIFLSSDGRTKYDKVFIVAAGFALIGVPFVISSQRHTKKGVIIYNNGLKNPTLTNKEIKIGVTDNGLGLKIRF